MSHMNITAYCTSTAASRFGSAPRPAGRPAPMGMGWHRATSVRAALMRSKRAAPMCMSHKIESQSDDQGFAGVAAIAARGIVSLAAAAILLSSPGVALATQGAGGACVEVGGVEEASSCMLRGSRTFQRAGRDITILQRLDPELVPGQAEAKNGAASTGAGVWEASVLLTRFMEAGLPAGYWQSKSVVELGAGGGLASLTAAALGADVILTDGNPGVLALAGENIALNDAPGAPRSLAERIHVRELSWGDPAGLDAARADLRSFHVHPAATTDAPSSSSSSSSSSSFDTPGGVVAPDVVLASDVVYDVRSLGPLIRTLGELTGPGTEVWVSCKHRVPAEGDIALRMLRGAFDVEEVAPAEGATGWADWRDGRDPSRVSVYRLVRKAGDGEGAVFRAVVDRLEPVGACDFAGDALACMELLSALRADVNTLASA